MSSDNQNDVKIVCGEPQITNNVASDSNVTSDSNVISVECIDVKGGTVKSCSNSSTDITGLTEGVMAKIPVILAQFRLQMNIDSIIELPEFAYEIKDIKKHLKITQCLLLQNTNVLFIKGYVRKNIQYTTRYCSNEKGFCGNVKHCTIDVPFKCTTPITFNGIAPSPVINRTSNEFEYLKEQNIYGPGFAEKDKLLSGDLTEFNKESTEYFNELPYCKIIRSRIVEFDEYLNPTRSRRERMPFEEKRFKKIEEKMVVYLTLQLLQNRQVEIPPSAIGCSDGDC